MTLLFILVGVPILIVAIVAIHDLTQRKHAITRNFPVIGHFRYWFEELGQPLRQYLFAGDRDERPYNRVTRSWVYASAKGQNNLIGFGSQADPQELGRILIVPSLYPTSLAPARAEKDLPRPARHWRQTRAALPAAPIRQHFRHELRRAVRERGPRAVTRRPTGGMLHEHRRGLAVAVSPGRRLRHPLSDRAGQVWLPHRGWAFRRREGARHHRAARR